MEDTDKGSYLPPFLMDGLERKELKVAYLLIVTALSFFLIHCHVTLAKFRQLVIAHWFTQYILNKWLMEQTVKWFLLGSDPVL